MSAQERALAGDGEGGARMRARDWSQTPRGPVGGWPLALRTTSGLVLGSPCASGASVPSRDMKGRPS